MAIVRAASLWMIPVGLLLFAPGCNCGVPIATEEQDAGDPGAGADAATAPDASQPDNDAGAPEDGGGAQDGGGTQDAGDGGVPQPGDGGANGGTDAGPGCPPHQLLCGSTCVSPKVDPAHCGGCGIVCSGATACSAGVCSSSCQPPLVICNNQCVDLNSDSAHCGMCGMPCPTGKGCVNGLCKDTIQVGPAPAKCAGGGPPIYVTDAGSPLDCAGALAQVTFRWALCSCGDIGTLGGPLFTDGYDSSKGPYIPGGTGAGVGLNGAYSSGEPTEVWGTLWSSAAGGLTTSASFVVKQGVHVGGPWTMSGATVDLQARVVGDISTSGPAVVNGPLYHSPGATISGPFSATSIVQQAITVPPPCDCAAQDLIPVNAIIAAHSTNNDNAAIGLNPAAFDAPLGADTRLDLPCGHYYLNQIKGGGAITIAAKGNTALYIGGDVDVGSDLTFILDPTSEFDVFIGGGLCNSATLNFGSANYPAQMRVYVGGTSGCGQPTGAYSLFLDNPVNIAANVYAPYGQVFSGANILHYGGIFAGSFENSASTTIHYDRAVLSAGKTCEAPPPDTSDAGSDGGTITDGGSGTGGDGGTDAGTPCTSCKDCGNQACVNGACGSCITDSDCCAPLLCVAGVCQVVTIN